jgi:uncharacterized alkaline shock family protein YloU
MADPRWERLPCGRDKERLLEIVAEGRPIAAGSHEATCPYCQAALAELNSLWTPVREWSSRPTPVPTHLIRTVIARVRRMTQSPHHVVATTAKGLTSVTSWVIAQYGAEAATRVTGVASVGPPQRRGGSRRHSIVLRQGADAVEVTEVGAEAVSLALSLTVRPVTDVLSLAESVRSEVIHELRRQTDLEVSEVDISVDGIEFDDFSTRAELSPKI